MFNKLFFTFKKMSDIEVVSASKHKIVFNVRNLPPKTAVTLRNAMEFDVPTMRIAVLNMHPSTNCAMDAQQWTDHMNAVPLDSRRVDEFAYVNECPCGTGGPCCQVQLQIHMTNESSNESLNVYSDDMVSSDPRVRPVHRTFNLLSLVPQGKNNVLAATSESHSFSDGDLVTVLDSVAKLPRYCRADKCTLKTLVLKPLFADEPLRLQQEHRADGGVGNSVGRITNRLLLYTLAPGQTVSWTAFARKGSAGAGTMRDEIIDADRKRHIKWSPVTVCYYRPLARDLVINPTGFPLNLQQAQDFTGSCPKRVFDIEDSHHMNRKQRTSSAKVVIKRPDDCDLCRACEFWARDNNQIGLVTLPQRKHPEWQQFVVKSNGSMDAYVIMRKSIAIVREKLDFVAMAARSQLSYPAL